IQAEIGPQECGIGRVEIEQRLLVLRQPEVVTLLFQPLDFAPAGRTLAVSKLRFRNEDFIDGAVPPLVLALVDVALRGNTIPQLLRRTVMTRFGRPDEIVVRDVEITAHLAERRRDLVRKRARRHSSLLGGSLDLLSVFVGAREKEDVVAE